MLRIVTWNINSLRLRMHHVRNFVQQIAPDVICFQETKVQDADFPLQALRDMGFAHVVYKGIKSYNGVAIASRWPLRDVMSHHWTGLNDGRHICATLPGGLEVHSLYVPAGGDIPERSTNPKFDHKLRFVDEMAEWFMQNRIPDMPIILAGDFNIAPLESDVWSHKQLLKVVSHTPIEVEKVNRAQAAFNWIDAIRDKRGELEKIYSWWSYRAKDWRQSNRGRRLDHIWVTESLRALLTDARVFYAARDWEKPSDHVPIIVDINWNIEGRD